MIEVHAINGSDIFINCDLIESVELIPETKISLTTGKYYLVSESGGEIADKMIKYYQQIYGLQKRIIFEDKTIDIDEEY